MKSMTAFGRHRETVNGRDITVEIKSVNSRYLDCSAKLPHLFSFLEEKIKPYLESFGISRGKVDVYVSVEVRESESADIRVDTALAGRYIEALRQLRDTFSLRDDISVMNVARYNDIFTVEKPEEDAEQDWEDLKHVMEPAVAQFLSARETEGAKLEADMKQKLEGIRATVDAIEQASAGDISDYKEKLEARLRKMLEDNKITADENRILTECAIFADKVAIDEELVRLRSHFTAFDEYCALTEPVGRKLDFLIQEMNREINTIGSKCNNAAIARRVVEVKTEIEKIREQVQNIE